MRNWIMGQLLSGGGRVCAAERALEHRGTAPRAAGRARCFGHRHQRKPREGAGKAVGGPAPTAPGGPAPTAPSARTHLADKHVGRRVVRRGDVGLGQPVRHGARVARQRAPRVGRLRGGLARGGERLLFIHLGECGAAVLAGACVRGGCWRVNTQRRSRPGLQPAAASSGQ